jgi:integrase
VVSRKGSPLARKPKRQTLDDAGVLALKAKPKRYAHPDPEQRGHYIRIQPSGAKTFVVVARNLEGKQIWTTIGEVGLISIDQAREKARETIRATRSGKDPKGPQSFKAVSDDWFRRHVIKKQLRSHAGLRRVLDNNILPAWSGRDFESIRRSDVAKLLDSIEDNRGSVAADKALAVIGGISSWYSARHEDYVNPIVRGMRRSNPKDRARDRILTDDELRAVWKQAEANGTFGAIVRILLLTGQRLDKVANMKWDDVSIDGAWTIATESREKGNAGVLVLPEAAISIIRSLPRFESNPHVFAGRGASHYNSFGRGKAEFGGKLNIAHWTLHDLRRTARSLMSRAGVRPDVAERVLGHSMNGVEGIYDRHQYREEKAQALKMLAGLIENILKTEGRENIEP